jgi:hypothetical protein
LYLYCVQKFSAYNFFCWLFFCTFFNGFKTPHQMLRLMIPISTILFRFYYNFLLTLKPKSDETTQKNEKKYFINMSWNPILHLSPVGGEAPFCKTKSKSLYPTAQPKLGPPCHHCLLLNCLSFACGVQI